MPSFQFSCFRLHTTEAVAEGHETSSFRTSVCHSARSHGIHYPGSLKLVTEPGQWRADDSILLIDRMETAEVQWAPAVPGKGFRETTKSLHQRPFSIQPF